MPFIICDEKGIVYFRDMGSHGPLVGGGLSEAYIFSSKQSAESMRDRNLPEYCVAELRIRIYAKPKRNSPARN